MRFKLRLLVLVCGIFLSVLLIAQSSLAKCSLLVYNSKGDGVALSVEIAATRQSRAKGLMHRKELPEHSGMLFVFEDDQLLTFWMKNVTIPLAIAYIDRDFIIQDIIKMAPVDDSILYPSSKKVRYALEVNQNFFDRHGISKGNRVDISACIKQGSSKQ